MGYKSTAKQRMWLTCLGHNVSPTADSEEVRSMFDEPSGTNKFKEPPTGNQMRIARELGISITAPTRFEAGNEIYHVLLLRSWVYSVWRSVCASNEGTYQALGLSDATALAIAREMAAANFFEKVDKFSTTDSREGDVFYRMSKSAQTSAAYQFALTRLPPPVLQDIEVTTPRKVRSRGQLKPAKASTGCSVLISVLFLLIFFCLLAF